MAGISRKQLSNVEEGGGSPLERLFFGLENREGILWLADAIVRLVGAVRAEQNDEWCCARRYMSLDSLKIVHGSKPEHIVRQEKIAA